MPIVRCDFTLKNIWTHWLTPEIKLQVLFKFGTRVSSILKDFTEKNLKNLKIYIIWREETCVRLFSVPDLVKISETNFQLKISTIISSCFSNNFSSAYYYFFDISFFFPGKLLRQPTNPLFFIRHENKIQFLKIIAEPYKYIHTGWRNPKMVIDAKMDEWKCVGEHRVFVWWSLWCFTQNWEKSAILP